MNLMEDYMKKKILIVLLLFACFGLTGCSKKMSEEEIKKALEVNTDERTFIVNKVTYATDKINVNGINMSVLDNKITLGDYSSNSNEGEYKQITGYYDQPGAIYHIYVLSKDTIWKIDSNESFIDAKWSNMNITNATDLILIDCNETTKEMGETPTRYQVYVLANNELVLLD